MVDKQNICFAVPSAYLAMILHLGQVHLIRVVWEGLDILRRAVTAKEALTHSGFIATSEAPHPARTRESVSTGKRNNPERLKGGIGETRRGMEGETERVRERERGRSGGRKKRK